MTPVTSSESDKMKKNFTQLIKIGKEHTKYKNVDFHFWNFFNG